MIVTFGRVIAISLVCSTLAQASCIRQHFKPEPRNIHILRAEAKQRSCKKPTVDQTHYLVDAKYARRVATSFSGTSENIANIIRKIDFADDEQTVKRLKRNFQKERGQVVMKLRGMYSPLKKMSYGIVPETVRRSVLGPLEELFENKTEITTLGFGSLIEEMENLYASIKSGTPVQQEQNYVPHSCGLRDLFCE